MLNFFNQQISIKVIRHELRNITKFERPLNSNRQQTMIVFFRDRQQFNI